MAWYVIDMPGQSLTDGVYHRFCRRFQRAFIDSGGPPGLALFAERNPSSEERRLFLSPECQSYVADMIREYGARSCPAPDSESVCLVYGVPGAQMLLAQHDQVRPEAPVRRKEIPAIYPITRGRAIASSG